MVKGIPSLNFEYDYVCNACQLGKLTRNSLKAKNLVSTSRPLELLHMDLFGLTRTISLGGKKYGLVIVDDYSRYSWVLFLAHKDETLPAFTRLFKRISNEQNSTIILIRSDHDSEFDNSLFKKFCNKNRIDYNFLAPRTPQRNGIVERKNRTLEEMAHTMLCKNNLLRYF